MSARRQLIVAEPASAWQVAPDSIDPAAVRSLVRNVTANVPTQRRASLARSFCYEAIARYWSAALPDSAKLGGLKPYEPGLDPLSEMDQRRAHRTGEDAARLSEPLARYLLSSLYAAMLPEDVRARNGVFFTPPPVVDQLLDLAESAGTDWCRHSVLDPAAGGGAFLAPVAMRMARSLAGQKLPAGAILEHVSTHLAGIEIDSFSAWMAQTFVDAAMWKHSLAAGARLQSLVVTRDALSIPDGWHGGYDLVVGNPPYGKVSLEPSVRARFSRSLFGHANLYGIFTDLAVRVTGPDGVVAFVTPASFLGGQYFKHLRRLLRVEASPVAIDFITDRGGVFEQVLQETVLIALRRGRSTQPVSVRLARPVALTVPCDITAIGHCRLPDDVEAPWMLPRSRSDAKLLAVLPKLPYRLRDYGVAVSTGPLVWNRHKDQLAASPGEDRYPLIWAESVLASGEFRFSWAQRNHQPYFHCREGQDHLVVRDPVILVQRTTAKEQSRRLVAAILPPDLLDQYSGAVVENHLNVVRPLNEHSGVSLRAIHTLLNSEIVDRIFRCVNGSVAVSAYEIESLPVPSPEAMHRLDALLEGGADAAQVEAFLLRAYNYTTDPIA